MALKRERTAAMATAALGVLLIAGAAGPAYLRFLFQLALGDGLAVLGLMVLMRAGLVSFGQGFYYCLGGYAAGIIGTYVGLTDGFALLLLGAAAAAAAGLIAGLLIARYREIFFAMLTLALTMILYGLLVNNERLGSTDGFNVPPPHFLWWAPAADRLGMTLFVLSCVVVGVAALALDRYLASPMGWLGEAIRENELRVEYLGVSVLRLVLVKYVIAAALAGAGGVLTALAVGHVDPGLANWTTSGEFLFMALLGGTQNVIAPLLGAMVLQLVRTYALQYAPYLWQMILGATMLVIILLLPNGLWSLREIRRREANG
jgi:ABC-type branched-subunit amino acid transport system permease subunit